METVNERYQIFKKSWFPGYHPAVFGKVCIETRNKRQTLIVWNTEDYSLIAQNVCVGVQESLVLAYPQTTIQAPYKQGPAVRNFVGKATLTPKKTHRTITQADRKLSSQCSVCYLKLVLCSHWLCEWLEESLWFCEIGHCSVRKDDFNS